jgi:hypothetical protein
LEVILSLKFYYLSIYHIKILLKGSYIGGFWKLYWSERKLYWREKEVILEVFGSYIGGFLRE